MFSIDLLVSPWGGPEHELLLELDELLDAEELAELLSELEAELDPDELAELELDDPLLAELELLAELDEETLDAEDEDDPDELLLELAEGSSAAARTNASSAARLGLDSLPACTFFLVRFSLDSMSGRDL